MLGMDIMGHQDLVLVTFTDEMFNQMNPLSVAREVDGRLDLVVGVLNPEQVELTEGSKLLGKVRQLSVILDGPLKMSHDRLLGISSGLAEDPHDLERRLRITSRMEADRTSGCLLTGRASLDRLLFKVYDWTSRFRQCQ